MSRRTKFNEETISRILEAIRLGSTYKLAAAGAGISERTFYGWMEEGRDGLCPDKTQFLQDIKEAEAISANEALESIRRSAMGGQWQAAAWILERRYGYLKREAVDVTTAQREDVSPEQLHRILQNMEAADPGDDYEP